LSTAPYYLKGSTVQSVPLSYIFYYLIIIISSLHVSGGFSAHHQELIKLYVQPWVRSTFGQKFYVVLGVKRRLGPGEKRQVNIGKGTDKNAVLSPIICQLCSEYFTAEALEGFGNFKVGKR
jgi:hypothetical protein